MSRRYLSAVVTVAAVMILQSAFWTSPAHATDFPNSCPQEWSSGGHGASIACYNPNNGTMMYGALGTWHDNLMTVSGSSASNPTHINEAIWGYTTQHETTGAYIEGGLRNGWFPEDPCGSGGSLGCVAYAVYWAETAASGTEYRHFVTNLTPDGINHEYELLRSGCGCQFNFLYDFNYQGSASHLNSGVIYDHQMGLETPSIVDHSTEADTFGMLGQYRDTAGTWHFWPSKFASVEPGCGPHPIGFCLNGSPGSSPQDWFNNKPA